MIEIRHFLLYFLRSINCSGKNDPTERTSHDLRLSTAASEEACIKNMPRVDEAKYIGKALLPGKDLASSVASGKGVRAILHAAFNVALLLFCHRRGLSHPRFLVLDTPLLTYREPLTSKHGELSDDESALAKSDLAISFYRHELKHFAQIIVLENATPSQSAGRIAKIEVFSGKGGTGRQALFPMSDS
jgi:hypothetical protein